MAHAVTLIPGDGTGPEIVEATRRVLEDGIASGDLPPQDVDTSAAALVGAIGEALVGPVSPTSATKDPEAMIASLVEFCIRSVTARQARKETANAQA